jgi:membrane dipeptidase
MPNLAMRSHAQSLLRASIVWDNHACLPLRADERFLPQLERLRTAGVSVVSLNVGYASASLTDHLRILSFFRRWISLQSDRYALVSTVEDVHRCKQLGMLGVVFDVEGMCPIEDNLSWVQTFYELGVRWMLIAYNRNNAAGGGCLDEDTGLTSFGRAVIDEMERVGMVLCLSHTGCRTATDALDYARNPVIFSHSNPYGDTPHSRNISDQLMRACASKGGVVGLSGIGPFLGSNENPLPALLRQLRYVIDLIGPDHVGLGLDYVFDRSALNENVRRNPSLYPAGVTDGLNMVEPEHIREIAESLVKANLTDENIRGVLGGNWLRVASTVWQAAPGP